MTDTLYCYACKRSYPRVAFWRDRSRPGGYSNRCKNCDSIRMSAYWREVYYPRHRRRLILAAEERRRRQRLTD